MRKRLGRRPPNPKYDRAVRVQQSYLDNKTWMWSCQHWPYKDHHGKGYIHWETAMKRAEEHRRSVDHTSRWTGKVR